MNQKSYLMQRLSLLLVATCLPFFAFGQDTPTGEVTDEHGIIITPAEGQTTLYERTGQGMFGEDYGDGMLPAYEDQDGTIEMVECSDGTVYFKDIISEYRRGYWVKGSKEGNTIHIPAYQVVAYSADYDASIVLRWAHGIGDGTIEADDSHADGFTFTIDRRDFCFPARCRKLLHGHVLERQRRICCLWRRFDHMDSHPRRHTS